MASKLTLWDRLKEVEVLGGIADGIGKVYTRFFGSRNERVIREHLPYVAEVNNFEAHYETYSDEELLGESKRLYHVLKDKIKAAGGDEIIAKIVELRASFQTEEAEEACKKYRALENTALDEILPQAFSAMRESAKRQLRIRHYDVQMLGGLFLHKNKISEMITGEGKTLVANLPCYLNAIPGLGVHVVTVNDYLAKRDAAWNRPLFAALGMTVGTIQAHMPNELRRQAYACHLTYGTNSEFGFDYLRDNMKVELEKQVQGRFKRVKDEEGNSRLEPVEALNSVLGCLNYAIVDEVDSILIDEARTPLIISGGAMRQVNNYHEANAVAQKLKGVAKPKIDEIALKEQVEKSDLENRWDFVYSEKDRQAYLTETGIAHAEKLLGRGSLYDPHNHDWPHFLEQALSANVLYKRDVQYVVEEGEVIIVDENTGRPMYGRTWSDGLHQAIEAKEGVKIKEETQTLATITLQNLFRLYSKLAGMTGTAMTEAAEFSKIYKLDTVAMPTNWPLQRKKFSDVIYMTVNDKFKAICAEVEAIHAMGRPVLVGTVSVENSERLSEMLARRGVAHEVLNAKKHQREAGIVEIAGQLGRVTIATNMAGRGTDIVLGKFTKEELLEHWKAKRAAPKDLKIDDPQFYDKLIEFQKNRRLSTGVSLYDEWEHREFLIDFEHNGKRYQTAPLATSVAELGGLHILGSERHESRRIDNQLRGRCGRQGDPGSSRFYLSLRDDLMRIFASDRVTWLLEKLGMEEGQEISHSMVTNAIEKAQKKVEAYHFDIRKNLLEFDGVMDEQRKLVYGERQAVLSSEKLDRIVMRWFEVTLESALGRWANPRMSMTDWDLPALCDWFKKKFDARILPKEFEDKNGEEIGDLCWQRIKDAYAERRLDIGEQAMTDIERFLLLEKIDEKWKDHLHAMDQLRSTIGLRGYAQEDPKVKYKKEGYAYFEEMWENIADDISDLLFHVRLAKEEEQEEQQPLDLKHSDHWNITETVTDQTWVQEQTAQRSQQVERETANAGGEEKRAPERRTQPKVSRNAKCPCGSGMKYKKCCGKKK